MAIVDLDSFDRLTTAGILTEWTNLFSGTGSSPAVPAISSGNGARGTRSLRLQASGAAGAGAKGIGKVRTTSGSTFIWGVNFRHTGGPFTALKQPASWLNSAINLSGSPVTILTALLDPSAAVGTRIAFGLNTSGYLLAYRPSDSTGSHAATLLGTSSTALTFGVRQYLEFKVVLDTGSSGSVIVKLNSATILSLTGIQTNLAATGTGANQIAVGPMALESATTIAWDFDDFYWCDGSGSLNTTFLGPQRIDCLRVTGEGHYTDSSPSSGLDRSAMVDEQQANNDSDYNVYSAVNDEDSYVLESSPVPSATMNAMKVAHYAKGAGTEAIKTLWRVSGSDYLSAASNVASSYGSINHLYDASPVDGTTALATFIAAAPEVGTKRTT